MLILTKTGIPSAHISDSCVCAVASGDKSSGASQLIYPLSAFVAVCVPLRICEIPTYILAPVLREMTPQHYPSA